MKTTRSRSNLLELFFFFNKLHFTQTSLLIHQPSIHTLYSCHTVVATLRTDDRSYKGIEPPPQKPFSQFFFVCFFQILCRVRQRRDLKVKVEMSREYADPYRLPTPLHPHPPVKTCCIEHAFIKTILEKSVKVVFDGRSRRHVDRVVDGSSDQTVNEDDANEMSSWFVC